MRMRKKWWAIPTLVDSDRVYFWPEKFKGSFKSIFKFDKIHLDIGCGSGNFGISVAKENPDTLVVLWDRDTDVLVYTLENVLDSNLDNIIIIPREIDFIENIFDKDEIDSMTIHFPNPWPKRSQHKRRLTHPCFLEIYNKLLLDGGKIDFRTDDDGLYKDTLLYLKNVGANIIYHSDDSPPTSPISHYELRFRNLGVKIKNIIFNFNKKDGL